MAARTSSGAGDSKGSRDPRGRDAETPSQIPARGWKDILWRLWEEVSEDRVTLIAAGASYYVLLALFPTLAAFVSLYGLVADPMTISQHLSYLAGIVPQGGLDLIRSQLESLVSQNQSSLSISFLVSLGLALWSANSGVKTLFEALNIAYGEKEKRSFIMLNLQALAFTLGAMLVVMLMIIAIGVIPAVLAFLQIGQFSKTLIAIARWPIAFLVIATGIALLYRYGPSREKAQWRWITWGSAFATIVWIAVSIGFSYYLQNFADYNATYGSLGAVIGFMIWMWLSVAVIMIGAELDAEMEHQTAKDTTDGEPKPMGERGAAMADTLGKTADET